MAVAQSSQKLSGNLTLGSALKVFFRFPTGRIIVPLSIAAWLARLIMGRWNWWDLAIVGVVATAEAFTEWIIHVFVLHFRPRAVGNRTLDLYLARKHRQHHADPRDLNLVFVPFRVFLTVIVIDPVVMALALPSHQLSVTAIATTYSMLGLYEWTHFLIHAQYRPKSHYYSYIRRAHRLHHYKNEKYWFGITVHFADHILGTFPDKSEVDTSPTARTLGVG